MRHSAGVWGQSGYLVYPRRTRVVVELSRLRSTFVRCKKNIIKNVNVTIIIRVQMVCIRENDTARYGQTLENPLSSMRYDGWLLIN